jgi:predicted DNA-binding transcriptional regulator
MMTTDGRLTSAQALLAIRDPAIRLHRATYVWLAIYASLHAERPSPIKIRPTAKYLRIKRRSVRRAIALLVERGYLARTTPATRGTAGEYVLGPAIFRTPMGPGRAPLPPSDTLPLFGEAD